MPMNNRIMVPRASGHPEAIAWRAAVIANGGTVSGTEFNAVNTFCRTAEFGATPFRSLLFRFNPFMGGLLGALVPLFRGPSRTGTQYGGTTDTNNGPFTSGDYSATAGLTGNGTSKYLSCGANIMNAINADSVHTSVFGPVLNADASGDRNGLTVHDATFTNIAGILLRTSANANLKIGYGGDPVATRTEATLAIASGVMIATAVTLTDLRLYLNGSQIGTTQTGARTAGGLSALAPFVFAANANGTPSNYTGSTLAGYSIGLGMTAAQAAAYSNACIALCSAVGRTL
jgi:hypothetical protein